MAIGRDFRPAAEQLATKLLESSALSRGIEPQIVDSWCYAWHVSARLTLPCEYDGGINDIA